MTLNLINSKLDLLPCCQWILNDYVGARVGVCQRRQSILPTVWIMCNHSALSTSIILYHWHLPTRVERQRVLDLNLLDMNVVFVVFFCFFDRLRLQINEVGWMKWGLAVRQWAMMVTRMPRSRMCMLTCACCTGTEEHKASAHLIYTCTCVCLEQMCTCEE